MFQITKKCIPYYVVLTLALIFGALFLTSLLEGFEFVFVGRIIKLRNICGWIGIFFLAYYLLMYFYKIFLPARGKTDIKNKGMDMIWQIFIIGGIISDWLYTLFVPSSSQLFVNLSLILDSLLVLLTMTELNLTFLKDHEDDQFK